MEIPTLKGGYYDSNGARIDELSNENVWQGEDGKYYTNFGTAVGGDPIQVYGDPWAELVANGLQFYPDRTGKYASDPQEYMQHVLMNSAYADYGGVDPSKLTDADLSSLYTYMNTPGKFGSEYNPLSSPDWMLANALSTDRLSQLGIDYDTAYKNNLANIDAAEGRGNAGPSFWSNMLNGLSMVGLGMGLGGLLGGLTGAGAAGYAGTAAELAADGLGGVDMLGSTVEGLPDWMFDPAVPAPDTLGADILDWSAKNPLTPSDLTNLSQTLTPEQWQQYAASVEQGLVNPALNPTTGNGILDTIRSTLTSVTGLDPKTQKTLSQLLLSGYMAASTNKNIQKQNDQSRALGTAAMPASYSTNLSPVTAGGALGTITGQPRDWRSTVAGKIPGYARGGAIGPLGKLKMAGKRNKSQRGGQADDIPAMLSEGEYVVDADTVAALGDGSNDAGASRLDQMRENVRTHKRSKPVSSIPPKAKAPEQYL